MTQTRSGIPVSLVAPWWIPTCTCTNCRLIKQSPSQSRLQLVYVSICCFLTLLESYISAEQMWSLQPIMHWMKILPINCNIILLNQNRAVITWLYLSQIVYSHNIFFYHGRIKLKLSMHKQRHLLSLTTLMLQLSRQRKRPSMPDTSRYR